MSQAELEEEAVQIRAAMNDHHPSVDIFVLNWNGIEYLPSCLSALLEQNYPNYAIYLIDNASTDNSVHYVQETFPQVKIIRNKRNLGYAAGNNQGMKNSKADIAILVNPDIIVKPGWLSQMVMPFASDKTIGIAGCKLFYPDGKHLQHAGGFITHPRAMPGHRGMGTEDHEKFDTQEDVAYVIGAAIAFRVSMFQRIGYLDEGYFMYFEDADFCQRVLTGGYRVIYLPEAVAIHDESAIAKKGSPAYLRRFHTGRWRFILKHFDLHEILESTIPEEKLWLAGLQGQERLAIDQAYQEIQAGLQEILSTRTQHGASAVPPDLRDLILSGVIGLRETAVTWPPGRPSPETLTQKALVQQVPFHSGIPVIGSIIAGFRAVWASIAVRDFVSPLTKQQNQLNHHFITETREQEQQMTKGEADWLDNDKAFIQHKQQIKNLKKEVRRTYGRIFALEQRIRQLDGLDVDH